MDFEIEGFVDPSERTGEPKVGIYFVVANELLIDAVPLEKGELYGSAIQHGEHYEFWKRLVPKKAIERKFKARAYDAYPRGRVIYFQDKKKFCIYIDPCLKTKNIAAIAREFGLCGDFMIETDEHYKCASCNPHFMD
jgi:hypothetical protein